MIVRITLFIWDLILSSGEFVELIQIKAVEKISCRLVKLYA